MSSLRLKSAFVVFFYYTAVVVLLANLVAVKGTPSASRATLISGSDSSDQQPIPVLTNAEHLPLAVVSDILNPPTEYFYVILPHRTSNNIEMGGGDGINEKRGGARWFRNTQQNINKRNAELINGIVGMDLMRLDSMGKKK